jgi:uncharacterized coiled-coil protein SlyX
MNDLFNSEMISLLALFTSLMATLVLILVGRKAFMNSKEARFSALDELIEERKSVLGDKGKLEAEVETLTKKQDHLQSLTQALQNDINPLKSKHADAVLEYEKQKEKLRNLREEWRQLQDKVELYQKRIKQLNELEEDYKKISNQRDSLKIELEKLDAELKQAQEATKKLEDEIKKAELEKGKRDDELKELGTQTAEQKDVLVGLEKQITQHDEKLKKKEKSLTDIKEKIDRHEKELKEKEKNIYDTEIVLETRKNELNEDIKKLNDQRDSIKDEIEKSNAELKRTNENRKKLEDEIEKIGLEKVKHNDELKDLGAQITERKSVLLELEKRIAQHSEKLIKQEKSLNHIEEKIARQDEELKNKERNLNDTQIMLEARKNELKTIGQIPEDAFKSLRTPWLTKVAKPVSSMNETKALDRLNKLVVDSGFELSKRLQYAFHTSLKTSDISCLTVMAGVSGTGKSAFPKIYAQAMGIHFLPLAVEPRWDSPQDLFGFLNYMENRYEATTLGRALVQFNNSPYRDRSHEVPMNKQVLMVLLDEMNLARIEYYFSEFLSKLEMRRNSDAEELEDYNNVSLEIYAGHGEDVENEVKACPSIRLFAGDNILFVGTMNEDESTQSLSDKVIDRANVIHFGRPDRLKNVNQNISKQRQKTIAHGVWRGWHREPDDRTIPDLQRIENLLNDINSVLGDLGRPFGWRNYKAILTYIANYPEQGNSILPMSDQVAMRVMPKLRGLDLGENAEAFNRFNNLLAQINDPALTHAFEDARNNAMGFFNWRGLNWDS